MGRLGENYAFAIWVKPRQTIRNIINERIDRLSVILAVLVGITQTLLLLDHKWNQMSIFNIFLIGLVLGAIGGILFMYIIGAAFTWTGRMVGGKGSFREVRLALIWGNVPQIYFFILRVIHLVLIGDVDSVFPITPFINHSNSLILIFVLLEFIIAIWSIAINLKSLGEAHQFSAAKALQCVLLPSFIIVMLFTIFIVVHGLMT
ncbi:Yip1 family protein [Paenibacillus sp. N3.4]|uniref:Yip1 family protein n=1 Tax=Paenibacillus sp. N3.4 TaxID=2603222 RepID=UPI00164FD425|nr:Yip1 family protein [Paenibacillus sp. N3.4]